MLNTFFARSTIVGVREASMSLHIPKSNSIRAPDSECVKRNDRAGATSVSSGAAVETISAQGSFRTPPSRAETSQ